MSRRRFEDPAREASIRPDRIGSLLARIVQERIVRGFADPRIRGMISVTGVDVSPDLRSAIVRVSVLPESDGPRSLGGLRSVAGLLRRTIRDQTSMKRVPDLEFRLDDSLKRAASLDEAIRDGYDGAEAAGETAAGETEGTDAVEEHPGMTQTPDEVIPAEDGHGTLEERS